MKLDMEDTVALTLFEFLSRTLDERNARELEDAVVHDGELWALNELHGVLEKTLCEPLEPSYPTKVNKARELLVLKFGNWPEKIR